MIHTAISLGSLPNPQNGLQRAQQPGPQNLFLSTLRHNAVLFQILDFTTSWGPPPAGPMPALDPFDAIATFAAVLALSMVTALISELYTRLRRKKQTDCGKDD